MTKFYGYVINWDTYNVAVAVKKASRRRRAMLHVELGVSLSPPPSIHPWDLGVRVIRAARIDFKTRVQSWGRSLIFLPRPHSQVGSTPWELRSTHNHTIPSITTTLPRASIHAATKGYLWNYNSVREGQARQGRAGHRRGSLSLYMYRYVGSPVIQCACVCAWPA